MAADERRKHPRFAVVGPIVVTTGSGEEIRGETIDLSVLGFRFYSNELLEVGESVSATVRLPNGNIYAAEGIIRYVAEAGPYCYGVMFTEQTMQRLIKDSFGPPESGATPAAPQE